MSDPPLNDLPHPAGPSPSGATDALIPAAPPPQKKRGVTGWLSLGWTVLFRIAILAGGVGLAWLIGALAAQLLPGPQPQRPPFQEVAQRRVNRTAYKVRQLPRWWSENISQSPTADSTAPPSSNSLASTAVVTPENPTAAKLDEVEREAVKSELSALETEFSALDNRLADLETKLGEPVSDAPLENRLQQLNRALVSNASTPTAAPASPPTQSANPPSQSSGETKVSLAGSVNDNPLFQLSQDRVTLPSSLLFAPEQSLLTPSAERILDTILPDLSRYPGATIVVGSYSDGPQPPEFYQDLTFKQALAVQQYLASRLGENYRWIPVGYGQTDPLVTGSTPSAQQRNQRLEIGIVPRN